ncbi:MAG: acyl-CoA dehydrogenase family protein [Dehalococcoidia bacterium]
MRMDFRFSAEEEAFRREVREFLDREIPERWRELGYGLWEETDESWAITKAWNRKLGEKGWLAPSWPKEYGGQARSLIEQLILDEEMAYHGTPTGIETVMTIGWVCPTIMIFGTEEQKRDYLPQAAKGDIVFCLGYSEPGAGSDLAGLQTRAVEDGDVYVINGQKIFTSVAHRADYCWLAARTDPDAPKHKGISIFVVDMKTPGITVRPLINMLGFHSFNEIFFDDVRIPNENLVGEKDRGWYQLAVALDFERSGVGMPAGARRTLEELVEYCKETQCNGEPLAKDPVIRHKLSERAVEIEVNRLICYRITWMQSKGIIANYEASMGKLFSSELLHRLANTGMQILGLHGQLDRGSKWAPLRGKIARAYLSSHSIGIGGGTSEIQRNIIAMRGLGLPRE